MGQGSHKCYEKAPEAPGESPHEGVVAFLLAGYPLLPGGTRGKEGDSRMRASRTALELGRAFARLYLEQAFGYGNVECLYRPDEEDTRRGTRSFWIDNQGRQRIYFSIKMLVDKRDPRRVLQNLQGSELADYIRNARGAPVMMTTEGLQIIGAE